MINIKIIRESKEKGEDSNIVAKVVIIDNNKRSVVKKSYTDNFLE